MTKIPDFTVRSDSYSTLVSWQDGTRRYHFWIDRNGVNSDGILHSNPVVPAAHSFRSEYRAHNIAAKKRAPTIAAIMDRITAGDMIEAAKLAHVGEIAAMQRAKTAKIEAAQLRRFTSALQALPCMATREAIERMPDAAKLQFMTAIDGRDE